MPVLWVVRMSNQPTISTIQLFDQLFGSFPAHTALLDLDGKIIAVNPAWNAFGQENGLSTGYQFEGKNYISICESAVGGCRYAVEALVGLLEVIRAGRPTFAMTYPCHSPSQKRWYRLWIELQLPHSPTVIVAHTKLKDQFDVSEEQITSATPPVKVPLELLNQPFYTPMYR